MTLYLYKLGTNVPAATLENVRTYTADRVMAADGTIYAPIAEGWELSSKPDCSDALRANWREAHPDAETRMDELEALVAQLLFGGETE